MNFSDSSYTKLFYDLEKTVFPCGSSKGLFLIKIDINGSILLPKHCYINIATKYQGHSARSNTSNKYVSL